MSKIKEYMNKIKEAVSKVSGPGEKNYQFFLNILIIILINIAGMTMNLRCDLTRNSTYSLADKSKEVVSELKENMKIKVLFSENLPGEHSNVQRYLKDLLQEYSYYGNEYFSYEIVDAKELEKQASDYGIQAVQSREFVDDQVKLRRTYMGVVIQHADLVEKINALTDTAGLEYKVTSLMEKMSAKIDGLLNLKKPITLRLYLDSRLKDLPIDGIGRVDEKVRGAVAKCNLRNYDKIKFELVDLSKSGAGKDVSSRYGIHSIKWGGGRTADGKKMAAGEGVFGIVMENGDRFRTIDVNVVPAIFGNYVIDGIQNLENNINDAVSSLFSSNLKVGYVTGHGIADIKDERTRDGAGMLGGLLSDKYEIVPLDLSKDDIPDNVSTIIINGPKDKFSDMEIFKIDQHLMMGRKALFFIDSFREFQMPGQQNMFQRQQPVVLPVTTGLEGLLKHYGVTVQKNIVLDKSCKKVNMGQAIRDYPAIPDIRKQGLSKKSIITKYLNGAVFVKTSSVTAEEKLEEKGVNFLPLVSTSDESWLMTGRINFNPFMMDANRAGDMKSHDVAALLSGSFESYYKEREAPLSADDKKKKTGVISTSKKQDSTIKSGKSEIIVVGTSEITHSGFMVDMKRERRGGLTSNDHLIHSMVDYLTGNYYVPEMQSKSLEFNPLDKTEDSTRFIFKTVNIAGVPFFVIIAGLIVWRRRISRKKSLMIQFSGEGR